MTQDPLTDEELAAWEEVANRPDRTGIHIGRAQLRRLLSEVRALRAEIGPLRDRRNAYLDEHMGIPDTRFNP